VARVSSASPRTLVAVAVVVLLLAGAVGWFQGRGYFTEQGRQDSEAAALAAGRQLAVNFVTMDYRRFDDYGKQVLAGAGGSFRSDYSARLGDLRKVVVDNKTVSSVKKAEAAVVSADDDSARVIVGVVAPTSNASTPQPVDKTYRLRLDLERSGSSWKVISLEFVG
jgi:Mce-associated membrane protein